MSELLPSFMAMGTQYWLVVLTILKNINGKDYPIYDGKNMIETTNKNM
jgi:hypothetical protein